MPSFKDLDLSAAMQANLAQLGFSQPTDIQASALPHCLAGRDVIAMAQTGSGKTAAFGIGLIESLKPKLFAVQGLVLCPTRELADQVTKALREMARAQENVKILTLCGGVSIGPQIGSLAHGAHIVVGTPGRIADHLRKGTLDLKRLSTLVLDEADRMLDMGFQPAMEEILGYTPKQRQTLMFSATWPESIRKLSAGFQRDPVDVRAEAQSVNSDIRELFYEVPASERTHAIVSLLSEHQPASCLVFCAMKQQCDELAADLGAQGFSALALHGDLEQRERDSVLVRFANQSCQVLVATDVAARGLDIKALPLVINAEPARDPEVHTHRVGRTGRAGEAGLAVTLCSPAQGHKINRLESERGSSVVWGDSDILLSVPAEPVPPAMRTLCIAAGRKDKLRRGDVLGALTGEAGLDGKSVGKIDLFEFQCFVAVEVGQARRALKRLEDGKIKGRKLRVRLV
ncbi:MULTISPECIES: ATP-dependent RNA helicase DbpA [unclassified Marinobacter]|uniref:ATP-dependent RNA helicase DbpA n=1 Tax=unclassified Marinobacter TaxID=83889 RepID=UPI0019031AED|nr:ATP-dependent RNA helicase DbpA [Marinobacter sp. 1-4A]MBK1852619.1 ATP-dependent RNA helicase DbpA [Marinobacter sp. 1-4A]